MARTMRAQAQAPTPDPALKKFQASVGHWAYEAEFKAGPLGPGGKFSGELTIRMILGGFFRQARSTLKGAMGEMRTLQIAWYDPANKKFAFNLYMSSGICVSGSYTFSGNTQVLFAGKFDVGGKQYQIRGTDIFAPDWMSITMKGEMSADGNTWMPWIEGKLTKAKPAAKK